MVWLFWFPNPAIFIAASIALTSACKTFSHVGKRSLSFTYPLSRLTSVVFCDRIVKMRHSSTSPAPSRVGTPSKSSNVSDMSAAFCLSSNCVFFRLLCFKYYTTNRKNSNAFYAFTQGHLVLNKFSDCLNFWILFFKSGAVPNRAYRAWGVQNRAKNRKLNSPAHSPKGI